MNSSKARWLISTTFILSLCAYVSVCIYSDISGCKYADKAADKIKSVFQSEEEHYYNRAKVIFDESRNNISELLGGLNNYSLTREKYIPEENYSDRQDSIFEQLRSLKNPPERYRDIYPSMNALLSLELEIREAIDDGKEDEILQKSDYLFSKSLSISSSLRVYF